MSCFNDLYNRIEENLQKIEILELVPVGKKDLITIYNLQDEIISLRKILKGRNKEWKIISEQF